MNRYVAIVTDNTSAPADHITFEAADHQTASTHAEQLASENDMRLQGVYVSVDDLPAPDEDAC